MGYPPAPAPVLASLPARAAALLALAACSAGSLGAERGLLDLDTSLIYESEIRADAAGRDGFATRSNDLVPEVFGLIQLRYFAAFSDSYTATGEDTFTGFEMRRTRIGIRGNIHERVTYEVETQFNSSGDYVLLDAHADIAMAGGYSVRAGQFVLPFTRSFLTTPFRLLSMDRSPAELFFSTSRSQGVMLTQQTDRMRARAAFSDGASNLNADYTNPADADYALTARVEYLGAGTWQQFRDFTSWRGSETAWLIAGGVHWQSGGDTGAVTGSTTDLDQLSLTADAALEGDGINLAAALYYQRLDGPAGDFEDYGLALKGGFFVTEIVEIFGRWSAVFADSARAADGDFHELTLGLNYYLIEQSHAAKLTIEAVYFPEAQADSPVPVSTTTGVQGATDDQLTLRAQLQIVF